MPQIVRRSVILLVISVLAVAGAAHALIDILAHCTNSSGHSSEVVHNTPNGNQQTPCEGGEEFQGSCSGSNSQFDWTMVCAEVVLLNSTKTTCVAQISCKGGGPGTVRNANGTTSSGNTIRASSYNTPPVLQLGADPNDAGTGFVSAGTSATSGSTTTLSCGQIT